MAINQKGFTYDHSLLLKDAGAVTASGVGQVGGSNRIIDIGASRMDLRVIVDVSVIDTSSTDESYRLRVQFSNSPTFANTIVAPVSVELGVASVTGNSAATGNGTRLELACANEYNGVTYRYMRVSHVLAGTTPSINYTAYAVKTAI